MGLAILGRRGLWKAMKQGCCGGVVLACSNEVRKGFTVGDDPSVYVVGHGACVPTISAVLDLLVDLHVLPNKLLSGFVYFPLSGSQLLHPLREVGPLLPLWFRHRGCLPGWPHPRRCFRRVPRGFLP